MSQKSSQERLKAQIDAARRGLAEVPRDEVANDQLTQLSSAPIPERALPKFDNPDNLSDSDDQQLGATDHDGFQFFHRSKKLTKVNFDPENTASEEELMRKKNENAIETEIHLVSNRLDRVESALGLNQRHTLELINLLSSVQPDEIPIRPCKQSSFLRRSFWIVVLILGLGWFGLTPLGQTFFSVILSLT